MSVLGAKMENDKKLKKREEIVVAGLKVFCEKGYDGATVDDITKKAHCSHGLFYHYFDSKKELFNEAIKLRGQTSKEDISKKIESINDYGEKLKFVINKLFFCKFVQFFQGHIFVYK